MDKFKNLCIFEHSPEAIELVKSGKAKFSAGGILRIGDSGTGFLELAKPATLSISDFQSLFEEHEHAVETDKRIEQMEQQLDISSKGLEKIQNVGWLNNAAIQSTYTLTYEGFMRTLSKLECLAGQLTRFEQYVCTRDKKEMLQEARKYWNYLKTDAGDMRSKKLIITNSKIAEHLDQILAFIKRLLDDIKEEEDALLPVHILTYLLFPFANVVRKYSVLYYYENDKEIMPGNYDEWVNIISSIGKYRPYIDKLSYYIHLESDISFRDTIVLRTKILKKIRSLTDGICFDRHYIDSHTKEEYLSVGRQIRDKIEINDYYEVNDQIVVFLDK